MSPVRLERVECARCDGALFVSEHTADLGGDWRHATCLAEHNRERRL